MTHTRTHPDLRRVTTLAVLSAALIGHSPPSHAETKPCTNANALGVARTVQIDTTGGPGFGLEHYKVHDFLEAKEIVLTFDDGPQKIHTERVLEALAEHCTKATFFSIGKMALGYPHIIREVAAAGHTIGTHTWSHPNLRKMKTTEEAINEIERGNSAVTRAVGAPISSFFRFPQLQDSSETLAHLQKRNISMFSTDIDSFDFKFRSPSQTVKSVMDKLAKKGKGIILMHDIQPVTGKAISDLLSELKKGGYKIVHLTSKASMKTLPEFDAAIEPMVKGLPAAGTEKTTSNIVKTVDPNAPKAKLGGDVSADRPNVAPASTAGTTIVEPTAKPDPIIKAAPVPEPKSSKWFWQ